MVYVHDLFAYHLYFGFTKVDLELHVSTACIDWIHKYLKIFSEEGDVISKSKIIYEVSLDMHINADS